MNKYSYVTLLNNDSFVYGVMMLNYSLKQVNSKYPLLVLITDDVSQATQEILRQSEIKFQLVEKKYMPQNLYDYNYQIQPAFTINWKSCFTKYKIFDLIEYNKIIFLDADILVLKNLDDLFEKPHMTSALDGEYFNIWPDYPHFNTGCLVIEPSHTLYLELMNLVDNFSIEAYGRHEVIADQEVLNFYYKDWAKKQELHLNKYYDIFAPYILEEQIKDIEENSYFIHYIGRKPWAYYVKHPNENYTEYFYNKARKIIDECRFKLDWNKIIEKITLSIYAICKNEKDYIEKWLACFSKADYICVLDTGSTDGTWELLQSYKEKYPNLIIDQKIITPWRFDVARNYSLDLVPKNTDIYFMMDLDEIIKEDNWVYEIKKVWEPNFQRGVYTYNRNVDSTNDTVLRAIKEFRVHSKNWNRYINIVHEAIVNELGNKMFPIDICTPMDIVVWHYPKENKKTNYLELCEQDLEEYPDDAVMRLQLCIEYEIEKYYDKARKHYQYLLNNCTDKIQWFEIARCYTGIGYGYYKENNIPKALDYFREGRLLIPQFGDNYLLPLEIFYNNKDYQKVIELGELALQRCCSSSWCSITDVKAYNVYYLIGISYYYLKDYIKSLSYLSIAKQIAPDMEGIKQDYQAIFNEYYNTIGK